MAIDKVKELFFGFASTCSFKAGTSSMIYWQRFEFFGCEKYRATFVRKYLNISRKNTKANCFWPKTTRSLSTTPSVQAAAEKKKKRVASKLQNIFINSFDLLL